MQKISYLMLLWQSQLKTSVREEDEKKANVPKATEKHDLIKKWLSWPKTDEIVKTKNFHTKWLQFS